VNEKLVFVTVQTLSLCLPFFKNSVLHINA